MATKAVKTRSVSKPSPPPRASDWRRRLEEQKASAGQGNGSGSVSKPSYSSPPQRGENNTNEKKEGSGGEANDVGRQAYPSPVEQPSDQQRGFTEEQKAFIVEKFACFQRLGDIADEFNKRYGFTPYLQSLETYDGDSRHCRMGKRLRRLFDTVRADYVGQTAKVAVAHQAHRLRLIEKLIDKATTSKEFASAIKGLELAAKEMGGLAQQVQHSGTVAHVHASLDDAKAELAMRLQAHIEQQALPSPVATDPIEVEPEPAPQDPPPPQ